MAKTAELEEVGLTSSHEHTKITTTYRATSYERSFLVVRVQRICLSQCRKHGFIPGRERSWGKGNGNSLLEKNSPGGPWGHERVRHDLVIKQQQHL